MKENVLETSLVKLSNLIEEDICRRGLTIGDGYLTATEVANLHGVSRSTAHRALANLAQKKILVRKVGSGTYVGPNYVAPNKEAIKIVQILRMVDAIKTSRLEFGLLLDVLHQQSCDVSFQVTFIPKFNSLEFIKTLLGDADSKGYLNGVIAITLTREIYEYLDRLGVPTVVIGSLESNLKHLYNLDFDDYQAGHILAEYLIGKGHRNLEMVFMDDERPSIWNFHSGITQAMTEANLPANALNIFQWTEGSPAMRLRYRELFSKSNHPTGFINAGKFLCDEIKAAAVEAGLIYPNDLEVVHRSGLLDTDKVSSYPCALSADSTEEIIRQAGNILHDCREGEFPSPMRFPVPAVFSRGKSHV